MIASIIILVVVLDQLSKAVLSNFLTLNQSQPVIANIFHLTLVHNTGIAFGLFKGSSRLILIITIVGLVFIFYSLRKDNLNKRHLLNYRKFPTSDKISIALILGGAMANMIDRFRFGYVVDFLDFRIWPVFNIADSCITIGALILVWKLFVPTKSDKTRHA